MNRSPLALVAGRLVCHDCGAGADVAQGRALVVHAPGCPLADVLLDIQAKNKPLVVYDGEQEVVVHTATAGRLA